MVQFDDVAQHGAVGHIDQFEVREDRVDHLQATFGVGLHDLPLAAAEGGRLQQDVVGNSDLADVVHWGERVQMLDHLVVDAEVPSRVASDDSGVPRHAVQVSAGLCGRAAR